jgi:hypothetical protein
MTPGIGSGDTLVGIACEGILVVRQQDTSLVGSPGQYLRIGRSRKAKLSNRHDVQIRLPAEQAFHDASVNVLIGREERHCYSTGCCACRCRSA